MENNIEEKKRKIKRMKQVFITGGNYDHPSDFSKNVNKNIKILMESDRNCDIQDIKFTVTKDPRYIDYGMVYLAYIIAEVDIIEKPEIIDEKKHKKKKHKKKK